MVVITTVVLALAAIGVGGSVVYKIADTLKSYFGDQAAMQIAQSQTETITALQSVGRGDLAELAFQPTYQTQESGFGLGDIGAIMPLVMMVAVIGMVKK